MAEQFLEDVYKYANVITKTRIIIEQIRKFQIISADDNFKELILGLYEYCEKCLESDFVESENLFNQIQFLNDINDDLLIADILENNVVPIMERWIQSISNVNQRVDKKYALESTASGFLTIKNIEKNIYFHSNNNPLLEAEKVVEKIYDSEKKYYAVYGCGLGYYIYSLYIQSKGSITIRVYEKDKSLISYARKYGILDWVPANKIEIITKNVEDLFLEILNNNEWGIIFHRPSILQIEDDIFREKILDLFESQRIYYKEKQKLEINFYRNVNKSLKDIGEVISNKQEAVIVSGGPSFNDNIEFLFSCKNTRLVIAISDVYKKMIELGIRPDYVIFMDYKKDVLEHIKGLENETIPIILDVMTYWEIAEIYQGPIYSTYNSQNVHLQEKDSKYYSYLASGNCATTIAVSLMMNLDIYNLYLVGVDLSYPYDIGYASGIRENEVKDINNLYLVQGVCGKRVYTSKKFLEYKKKIEQIVLNVNNKKCINMSCRGIHIEGTIEYEEEKDITKYNVLKENIYLLRDICEKNYLEYVIKQILKFDLSEFLLYLENNKTNIYENIYVLSVLYETTNKEITLQKILDLLEKKEVDCLYTENIWQQVFGKIFVNTSINISYLYERKINKLLCNKWKKEWGQCFEYIPYNERNKNTILIMTNQLLSIKHAPTAIVINIVSILVELGFNVYLLVNITNYNRKLMPNIWFNATVMNVIEDYYSTNILKYNGLKIPFMQVNYNQNTENVIKRVKNYISEIKPEFIWHIGGNSFIADIIGESSTMIATKCTEGYAVSNADFLASYMTSDSRYVKEALNLIKKEKQKTFKFISPITKNYDVLNKNYTRQKFGLPADKFLICLVGNRLEREVNSEYEKWIKEILSESDRFFLITIGSTIKESGMEERIIQLGYQDNLADVLQVCNVFINPPRQGGGGGAVAALAAGIPVLTLPNCDVATGVPSTFVVKDLEEMKEHILRYHDEHEFYMEMCKVARCHFEQLMNQSQKVDVQKSIRDMIDFIREEVANA